MSLENENATKNEYVLAMYDVRGKQEYIYSSSKMKQIAGASWIIRDCFADYLLTEAKRIPCNDETEKQPCEERQTCSKGIFDYTNPDDMKLDPEGAKFTRTQFEKHIRDNGYIGEIVYSGGGNFFVLFKDKASYLALNWLFTAKLLRETYTLRILTSYIEGVNFDDYAGDTKKLYNQHRLREQKESIPYPVNALPVVQTDYASNLPLTAYVQLPSGQNGKLKDVKVSRESEKKYKKYQECSSQAPDDLSVKSVKELDRLVEEKGEDSYLAVIYIDGNGMGAQVEKVMKGDFVPDQETQGGEGRSEDKDAEEWAGKSPKGYERVVNDLRLFSEQIETQYITEPMKAIRENLPGYRFVVYAGDEITFICNAKYAYSIVKLYFDTLKKTNPNNSSCAGVALFRSHAPFAEAYCIAEECCEKGKQLMKEKEIMNACLMDFQVCQGAIGVSLDETRKHEGTEDFCKPWVLSAEDDVLKKLEVPNGETVDKMAEYLRLFARSNSKTLLGAALESETAYKTELERIIAHSADEEINARLKKNDDAEKEREFLQKNRELVYRMMLVYDWWFRKEGDAKDEKNN